MEQNRGRSFWFAFFAAALFLIPSDACAYIDPQAGSVVFQVVIASVVVSLFSIKMFFRRIRDFITRKKK